jgi:DNA-binding response OmpR family regulator
MPEDQPLRGTRILIAEDNAIQALELMNMLQDAGAEVLGPARTVAAVLAVARETTLTCAVLDLALGHELVLPAAQALRERSASIVFYTGYGNLDSLLRDWPGAHVLSKPVSRELLLRTVRIACRAAVPGCV